MGDYHFNFPPEQELTLSQRAAVNYPKSIALSGGPGTGKSFVSLWRHIINHNKEGNEKKYSQLLTFTTSLAYFLKINSAKKNTNASEYVDSIQNWYFSKRKRKIDELIIDEAQDMPLDFYESEHRLRHYCSMVSYGADDKQILQPNSINEDGSFNHSECSPEKELLRIFNNKKFILDKNYRNTKSILLFAKTAFLSAVIPEDEINSCEAIGELPSLFVTDGDLTIQNNSIIKLLKTYSEDGHNIGILTPLANCPWPNFEYLTARYYYDILKDKFDVSCYDYTRHDGHGLDEMKNIHITPFKSAKGLEFHTVIIPAFHLLNFPFSALSWRDFFVGITRAKSNLFLFSDTELPSLYSVAKVTNISES